MLKIGTPVRYEGGEGKIDRWSTPKKGVARLYRVNDRWFERDGLKLKFISDFGDVYASVGIIYRNRHLPRAVLERA